MNRHHMDWIMKEDPSFKPFLTGLMSVELGIIVAFNRTDWNSVAYFMWRDPSDGRFHVVANLYENYQEMSTMNSLMDKRIAAKKNDIAYERGTLPIDGIWLLNKDMSFSKFSSPYREWPEKILERLGTLRATRKEFLARCAESERGLVDLIEEHNIVRGG